MTSKKRQAMLDIYFVPASCTAMPEDPQGLVHAGAIDLDAHRSLADVLDQCRRAGVDFSYFRDTLLRPDQVMTMLGVFNTNADTFGAGRGGAFKAMLAHAAEQGMGLAAFCD